MLNVDDLDKVANDLLMLHVTVNSGSIATVWPGDINFVSLQETIENQALLTSVLPLLQGCKVSESLESLDLCSVELLPFLGPTLELSLKDQR